MITGRFWKEIVRKTDMPFRFFAWWFVAINMSIHILTWIFPQITHTFALIPSEVVSRPWTLISAMFLHADLQHLVENMIALFIFGILLEKVIGSRNWLFVYFSAGLIGNLAGMVAYPDAVSLGASGAITGVVGCLAVLRPKMMVYIGGPLPMILLAAVWIVVNLAGFFNPTDNIGYAVHLVGYGIGILEGLFLRRFFREEDMRRKKIDVDISEDEFRKFEDEYVAPKRKR